MIGQDQPCGQIAGRGEYLHHGFKKQQLLFKKVKSSGICMRLMEMTKDEKMLEAGWEGDGIFI